MEAHYVDINSDLGEQIKALRLDYFAHITREATKNMSDGEIEVLQDIANEAAETMLETFNTIDYPAHRIAALSMFILNCATSLHLTLEHAAVRWEIEEEFGEGVNQ